MQAISYVSHSNALAYPIRLTVHDRDPHDWQLMLPMGYSAQQTPSGFKSGQNESGNITMKSNSV